MANVTQNVTLSFKADVSSAKSSIEQLKTSLTQIQTQASSSLHLDADLNSAKQAAKELQAALQSAVNVNTGQLNFTALNAQLQAAGTSVTQLSQQLLLAGSAGQSAFMNLTTAIAKSSTEIQKMSPMLQNMMTTLKNTFKWEMASKAIHGIESTISSAISYVTDLNKTLTDIRVVTGASIDDMTKFTKEANTMAKELSSTTKDIAKASLIYYQQGDNAELAMKKAAVTTKAANVAFTASAQEMSEMLTAVWNSYKVGEDELERVVDTMAALGATTSSSMEEIMTGMEKVSSTAHTVGVSINQMASIIATAASVTRQAPEQIGTAWNTMLSRFSSLKLGETLEDGLTLTKYTSALQSIGVEVMDATGQLRNMGDVISDIGGTWKTMTTAQKAALASTVGSVRQMNQMIAFFDNYDKYEKNLQTAENGAGTLQEQQDTFAESYEAAANRAKTAMQKLYGSLVDDQALIGFKNTMASITDVVADLVQGLGGIPGILGIVANSFTHTFSNTMATKIASMASSVTTFMAHPLTNISNGFQDWNARRTGQLTRDEQTQIKDIDKTRSQIQSEIGMAGSYNNQALQEQLALSDQILQKKQELITTSKSLSDADISNREKAIDLATQELAAIDQQRQKYEALKQTKENMFSVNTKYLAANGVDSTGWTRDDTSKIAASFVQNSLSQPGNIAGAQLVSNFNGDQTMEGISKVFESAEMATTGLTKFESALKSLSASSAEMQVNQTTLSGAIAGFEAVMDEAGIEGTAYKDKLDEIKRAYQDYQTAVASGDKDQAAAAFENVRAKIPDILDLIQKLRQELTTGSGQLGDIIDQGDEGRAERLRGKVDELAIALFGVKTQGQGVKDSLEQAFGSTTLDAKLQTFGKNMTKITSGLTGAVATFSQMSNLTKNWDTSSLTSKITSIGSTLMSIVNSKSIIEMAIKAGGAIIGGIIGAVEADAKRKAEALKELNKQVADSNQKNKESLDTYQETKSNFEELYRQKLQGLDVDDQLKASAQELGLSYDALQTSTDNVANSTAELAQKIKEVTAAQRERMQLDADAAVTQAKKAMGDTDYGFKSSTYASPGEQITADMASGAYSITGSIIESYFNTDYMKALQEWAANILDIDTNSLPQDITEVPDMIDYVNQILANSGEALLESEEYPHFMSRNEYMAQTLYGGWAQFRYDHGTGASISPFDYAKQAGIDATDEAEFIKFYSNPELWATLLNQGVAITHSGYNGPWTLDTISIMSGGNYKFQRAVENDYNQAKPESGLNAIAATGYSKVNAQGAVFSNIGLKAEDLKGDAYAALKAYNNGAGAKGLRLFANEYDGYAGNIGFLMSQDESEDYQLAAYDDMIEMERILEASGQTESNLYKQLKTRTDKMKETVEAYRTGLENADLLWSEGIGTTMLLSGRSEDSMEFEDFATTMDSIKTQAKQRTQDRADPTAAANTLVNNAQNALTGFDDYTAIWNIFEQLEEEYSGDSDKLQQLHQLRSEVGQHIGPNGEYNASDFSRAVIEDLFATPSDQRWQAGSQGMQTLTTTHKANAAAVLSTNYTKLQDLESAIKTNPTDADLAAMKTMIDWDKYDMSYADFIKLSAKGQKRKVGQWRKQELTGLQTNKTEQLTAVDQKVAEAQAAVDALSKTDVSRAKDADQFIETIDWQTGNSLPGKVLSYTQQQLQTAYMAALQQGEDVAAEWRNNYNQGNWDKLGLQDEGVVTSLTTVRDAKKALKQAQTQQTALIQDLTDIGVLLGQFSDDVLSDITTLSNAYSTLPTTSEGMDEVIELLKNAGVTDAEGQAYTAESLSALYKSDKKTYQSKVKSALSYYAQDETLSATGKQIAANELASINENEALDEKNKQVTKLANNATKYKDQISSLQSAIKEFVTDGQLSSKTKSTLEKLGLKPDDYKDLESLKKAMSNARTELVKTRDALKGQLGIQDFTGSIQDATMTWDEFKEHYKLQDDNLKSTFESWKTSFWDAKTAYDGWSEAAIEAQDRITKSVNAHKLAQDKLITNYNNLKVVSDDVTNAFQNNEQVSIATAKKLKEQGVIWQKGQAANLSNYGKVLGNTAIAQQQMLQGQKYDLNRALQTTGPYYMGLTHGESTFTQSFDLAKTDLRQFVNEYDDIVPISEKLAGGDGTVAQKIQEMVREAKEAGQSITWNDIFAKLAQENLEFDDQIASVWDSFAQSGISAIESVLSEHQSAAEQIVSMWTAAFQAIAAAQTTFAKGLNLNQDTDETTLANQAALMLGVKNTEGKQMFTYDQVATLIQGGNVTVGKQSYSAKDVISLANQQLELPTGATWATSQGGATQFLYKTTTDANGKKIETRMTSGQEMIENGRAILTEKWQDYIGQMDEEAAKAFKDAAKEKGLEGEITDETRDAWQEFAVEYLMNKYFGPDYASHAEQIYQTAAGQEIAYGAYYSGQQQKNAETAAQAGYSNIYQNDLNNQIAETQKTQAAIDKALSLKLSGKNLETNLSADEQSRVLAATGAADLASVQLGDLSSASSSAATALAQLTSAAAALAEQTNKDNGFEKGADNRWYYRETKSSDQLSASDLATGQWMDNGDGTYSRLNYSEAVTNQMRTFDLTAQEALDTVNNFDTNLLSQYADALGETVDTIGSYCEAIAMANGITMDWNNLTKEQQLLMAEAAIRFNETADAIQSLNTLGKDNGVVEALLGTAKQSEIDSMTMQDYAQAYRDIVNAVNDLYGEGAVSAEFFNAATAAGKEHLELLTEIAKGGEEAAAAMEKLQRAILDSFNTKNKLGFSSSELDDLSSINVKYGEQISDADLARINNLAQQHRLTAAQLKDLGNILGITLDIKQETRSVPTDLKGVQDAVQKIGKETRSTQKAADIAALIKADAKAFKGYNGEADEAKAKTQAIQDAWQQVADSGDIKQTAQEAADLAKTLNSVEGTEVKIEFNEDEIGSELANTLNSLPNVEAQIDYVANLPQIAPAEIDAEGTITYHTAGGDISFHTETKEATAQNSSSGSGSVSVMGITVPFSYSYSGSSTMSASVPVLDGASASGGTGNQAGNSTNGGRGGGGGGGGGRRTKQLKDDHDRTRYHQMDRQLKKQNDLLTKNDKLKSRKYGTGYLDSLKAENKELKNQIDLNKEKIKEAQKYLEQDKRELQQNGATFDEDDNLNYDAYEARWQDEYNRMVEQYNSGAIDDDAWTEFQRKYDNAMDAVDRYEEAQDRIAEAQEEILEAQNQISANMLEQVTYELELKVELDQRQIDLLQTMLKLYEKDLDKSGKLLTNYLQQLTLLQHQSQAAPDALTSLMSKVGITSLDNIKQDKDGFIVPTIPGFDGDKMTAADFAEGLKSIADQAQSSLDAIIEMRETLLDFYSDVLDKGEEKFSALANSMKHLQNMMSGYLELVDLYNTGGDVYDKKATIMEAQYDTQLQTIDMYEARMKLYQDQEAELEAELKKDPTNEAAKRALEDLKENKEQAEEEWLDAVKTAAQTAKDLYQNSVDEIMDQMNKLNGEDMDWLKTKADLWKQNNDLYVDEVTKIYEVDKLTRKIEDSIADTRSKSNQAELKALKEKIKLQADSNELSEYDIEMMNKEYELLLAKQDLENAQNAKNQVRLTRDENGNMIYQYTTDQDAVSEAEQKYNDVLYEMHKTSKEHLNELYETMQETEEAYREAVEKIWNDATLTAEEKQQRLDEVNAAYGKILDNLSGQIQTTYGNLTDYDSRLTERFSAELKGTAFDTDKYLNTFLVAMSEKADDFKEGMEKCQGALIQALDSYSTRVDLLQGHTHTKWEDMTSDLDKFRTAATSTKSETDKLIDTLKKSLEDAMNRIIKDFKNWNSEIEKTIKNLSSMVDKINSVLTTLASLGDDSGGGDGGGGDRGSGGDGGGGNRGSGGDGGGGDRGSGGDGGGGDRGSGGGSGGKETWGEWSGWKQNNTSHWKERTSSKGKVEKKDEGTHNKNRKIDTGNTWTCYCSVCGHYMGVDYKPSSSSNNKGLSSSSRTLTSGKTYAAATGGLMDYTGPAWVDGTEQNPEYVLNAKQTDMMFGILSSGIMDKLLNALTFAAQAMTMTNLSANNLANSYTHALSNTESSLEQTVYVTANFPAATDKQEIMSALSEIYNKTSQYVNRQTTVGL